MWFDNPICDLFNIEHPILLAPMAGAGGSALAIAVAKAGGLASLPCAMLNAESIRAEVATIRAATTTPLNLNFFTHSLPISDSIRAAKWKAKLAPYYKEHNLTPETPAKAVDRRPFDTDTCALVEALKPEVVSFHFGLPAPDLMQRVKAAGCRIIASATTVREAIYLEQHGCDAVIAQGAEAGGHRGMFLTDNALSQPGTIALVPQIADAIHIPVIAAGGIADARGIVAAFALGASAVQIGTAYLFCPESRISALHRQALLTARDDETALTNLFSGRPARGILNRVMRDLGPLSPDAPAFPTAGTELAPLKAAAEAKGSTDFSSLWSGQAAGLCITLPAEALTIKMANAASALAKDLGSQNA
ncbi:MAG: NAD(P)H-dependent flavin oxidoreductase [Paracoccaceae bacterium]